MTLDERPAFRTAEDYNYRLRLDDPGTRLVRDLASVAIGGPWLDPVASFALRRWYFPLSRYWAAAELAHGSIDAFLDAAQCAETPPNRRDQLIDGLARFERTRAAMSALSAAWETAFFPDSSRAATSPSIAELSALEAARRDAASDFNGTRRHFRLLLSPDSPRIHHEVPTPEEVDAAYGAALNDSAAAFAPPGNMPAVEESRAVPTVEGRDYWLRFSSPSPAVGDDVCARVYEPAGVKDPPTLIFGHGVCVEFDHWDGLIDEAVALCRLGVRVIRPEAAWHGRRRPTGFFGGERMIATFPMGSLDLFTSAVREWAVLADWARRTSSGMLAFGGSSLGALTAQLAASRARDWPERLRPDALLLITHCEQLYKAAVEGDLSRMWGDRAIWETHGWTADLIQSYLTLLNPGPDLSVPPENIVTVLGRQDRVTPFESGLNLIEKWRVPDENRFIWNRGHFSVPVTMLRNQAPLRRFRDVISG